MRSMRVGRMARLALATCLAMVLAVMVLAGCAQQTNGAGGEAAAAGDETTVTVTDLRGRMVEIPENPQRIVAVSYTHLDVYKRQDPRRLADPSARRRGSVNRCLDRA